MKKSTKIIIIAIAAAIVIAGTVIVALCVKHYNELYPNGTYAPETIISTEFDRAFDSSNVSDYEIESARKMCKASDTVINSMLSGGNYVNDFTAELKTLQKYNAQMSDKSSAERIIAREKAIVIDAKEQGLIQLNIGASRINQMKRFESLKNDAANFNSETHYLSKAWVDYYNRLMSELGISETELVFWQTHTAIRKVAENELFSQFCAEHSYEENSVAAKNEFEKYADGLIEKYK